MATKLTGRTGNGLSFGILDAVTEQVRGVQRQTVEPAANYIVGRAQQDMRSGEAEIAVIGTAVNRSADALTSPYLHNAAMTAGLSFRNRFYNGQYEVAGQIAGSDVRGSREAIYRTQRNSVHYDQQPGDDLSVDSSRTSLSGHAEQLKFGKYGGGITRFETRRRSGELEHVGRARLSGSAHHLSLGAAERQSLGDLEHVRHAP